MWMPIAIRLGVTSNVMRRVNPGRVTERQVAYQGVLSGAHARCMDIAVLVAGAVRVVATVRSHHPDGHFWHCRARFEVEVGLGWPVTCVVNGRQRTWSVTHRRSDVLDELRWWALYQLWGTDLTDTENTWHPDWGLGDEPEHSRCARELAAIESLIADQVWRTRDQDAAERVHGMDHATAFFAYTALLDRALSQSPERAHNRVAQMITVCPNLFTLASVAPPRGHAQRSLVEGIQRGEKLASLVRTALEIPVAEGRVRPAPLASQAMTLVRHLEVRSFDDLMAVLQAPGIDVNDLRAAGKRAHEWTQYMAEWGHRARMHSDLPVHRLGGFFSRHALALYDVSCMPEEVVDWVGRAPFACVPNRSSSPCGVQEAIQRWHASLWTRADYPAETPLAPGPRQAKVPGIEAVQIETVGALVAEGSRMAHCVASLASTAVEGEYILYSAAVLRVPMTIAVCRAANVWTLLEASGFANRRPTIDQLAVISQWVEGLR